MSMTTTPIAMKVTVSDLDLAGLALSEEQLRPRSGGVHVSSIIRHITKTSGIQKDGNFTEDDLELMALIGRAFEQVMANAFYTPPRYARPGELEKDGIIGSPDAVDYHEQTVHELKVTWQSEKNFRDRVKFRIYCWQGGAYCAMLDWYRCVFDVLHIRGNCTNGVPIPKRYIVEWTPQELKGNWQMLLRNIPSDQDREKTA